MNVIGDATDSFGLPIETFDNAAEIRMEFLPPFFCEDGLAVFGRKNEMVMEAGVGGGHDQQREDGTLPGCVMIPGDFSGGVARKGSTTG